MGKRNLILMAICITFIMCVFNASGYNAYHLRKLRQQKICTTQADLTDAKLAGVNL